MTTMKKTSNAAPHSLAACLDAAQSDADRFFGDGPVRIWRPAFDWRPWVAGAALAAVATLGLLWWSWSTSEPAPERVAVAAGDRLAAVALAPAAPPAAPIEAATDAATALAARGCYGAACAPPTTSGDAPLPAADPALVLVLPENLEAWALDPQPLADAPADPQPLTPSLVNTPVIPDEHDPTPADETAPDDEPVEAPAE